MAKVRIELNRAGVRELLKSQEMQEICREQAKGIQERAGAGYGSDVFVGKNRCNASVWPEASEAKKDNLKHNTLIKAVGA